MDVERACDDQAERIDIDRFGVKVPCAIGNRLQRAFACAVAGGDDYLGIGLQPQDFSERGEPFARAVGVWRQAALPLQ